MIRGATEEQNKLYADWCELFLKLPQHPMDLEDAEVFAVLSMAESSKITAPPEYENALYRILEGHRKVLALEVTEPLKWFLLHMSRGLPGTLVMYLHALKYLSTRDGISGPVTFYDMARVFPFGFPDDDGLRTAWDAQKNSSMAPYGNFLDFMSSLNQKNS